MFDVMRVFPAGGRQSAPHAAIIIWDYMGRGRTAPRRPQLLLHPAHGKICRLHEKAAVRNFLQTEISL